MIHRIDPPVVDASLWRAANDKLTEAGIRSSGAC